MRKNFSTLVLVLALGATVLAGDIPSPPAPTPKIHNQPLVTEDVNKSQSFDEQFTDGLVEAALNVLNIVLAHF